jgi:hypothetical protein
VHWLRARAQLKRWQEEVTLTSYEMQWTVRYFVYMSRNWVLHSRTSFGSGTGGAGTIPGNLTTGAIAYHKRKRAVWEDLTKKADGIFRRSNPAYQSPL